MLLLGNNPHLIKSNHGITFLQEGIMQFREIPKKIIDELKDKYGEHKVEYAINAVEID